MYSGGLGKGGRLETGGMDRPYGVGGWKQGNCV